MMIKQMLRDWKWFGMVVCVASLAACSGEDSGGGEGIPAAPAIVDAEVLAGPAVHVTWTDRSDNEEKFVVERKVDDGAFSQLAELEFDEDSYHDADVMSGMMYTYRIAAKNAKGTSEYSAEKTAHVP